MQVLRPTKLIAALTSVGLLATTASAVVAAPSPQKPPASAKTSKTSKPTTGKTTTGKAKKPDLLIRGLQVEFIGEDDSVLRVRGSVGNNGRAAPKKLGKTTIALSQDTRLGAGDILLAEFTSGRPMPGRSVKFNRRIELPATLPQTDTYLVICADSGNRISELRETNNCSYELLWEADEFDEDEGADDEDYDDDSEDWVDDEGEEEPW